LVVTGLKAPFLLNLSQGNELVLWQAMLLANELEKKEELVETIGSAL
jgi:hypothetical protein